MPAQRLGMAAAAVQKFDVLGIDAEASPEFIRHVGLAQEEGPLDGLGSTLAMTHMAPPLEIGVPSGPISSLGTASLTGDEILQIMAFVDNHADEYTKSNAVKTFDQYCVAPHVRERRTPDGDLLCLQFNCGGFVIEAYRFADIDLLETDPASLPLTSLEILRGQYPQFAELLRIPRLRQRMGIPGDGPWPVVLAGYVINAMNRPDDEIRAQPRRAVAGDGFFPPRPVRP